MTLNEAKKDLMRRLKEAGIPFLKITGRTQYFDGSPATCLEIHGGIFPQNTEVRTYLKGVPKPSEGGYIATAGALCRWIPRPVSQTNDSPARG